MKLEIAIPELAIPASNEGKIPTNNSSAQVLTHQVTHIRLQYSYRTMGYVSRINSDKGPKALVQKT